MLEGRIVVNELEDLGRVVCSCVDRIRELSGDLEATIHMIDGLRYRIRDCFCDLKGDMEMGNALLNRIDEADFLIRKTCISDNAQLSKPFGALIECLNAMSDYIKCLKSTYTDEVYAPPWIRSDDLADLFK